AVAFGEPVGKEEISLTVAWRVSDGETKKESFGNAGAERNANAEAERTPNAKRDSFAFASCKRGAGKRKAWCAERHLVTGSNQRLRKLSVKSAATSYFGARTHDSQSRLPVRLR